MQKIEKQITCQTKLNESTSKALVKYSVSLYGVENRSLVMRKILEEYVQRKGLVE